MASGANLAIKIPLQRQIQKYPNGNVSPGVLLYLPSFLFPVFSLSSVMISHDANSSLHYAPQTNISIAYTSYPYPIIILLFISLSYHPSYHPIIPILILLFPSLSYFITWSHFLVTTMALQINCSTFHSLLFGPQQDRVEQLISTEQSWPICYPWPLTCYLERFTRYTKDT